MSSEQLGSDPFGHTLSDWTCARSHNSQGAVAPCRNLGVLLCSKCRQVKYCTKQCQDAHQQRHNKTCSSSYASKKWKPEFERERRPAAWMTGSSRYISFGKEGNYLWGNMPAFGALNVSMNEGATIKDQDVALCFAASGDLRNVVKTINGLPPDYTGNCTLIVNDSHPLVAIRNIVLLCILLSPSGPSEEVVAEIALHIVYSSKLTSAQDSFLQSWINRLQGIEQAHQGHCTGQMVFSSHSRMQWAYPSEAGALLASIRAATYPAGKAEANRRRIMLAPGRVDYRERYYTCLRPRHRVGFAHFRDTGILLPIGQPVDSFSKVNRLLYSEHGDWLLKDNANPASAWSPLEVEATRQKLGLPDEDYIGSLFFYIKEQLTELDLRLLPEFLDLSEMSDLRFDRVETSNVMDSLGASEIISIWGPRLNRLNPYSTLLMYSMNWAHVSGSLADSQAEEDLRRMMMVLTSYLGLTEETGLSRAPITLLAKNLGAFFNTLPPFRRYLHVNGVASASSSVGIKERKAPRIVPSRFGVEIEQFDSPRITINREQFYFTGHILFPSWHERFIEFEVGEVPIKDPVARLFAPSTILWSIVVILVVYFFW